MLPYALGARFALRRGRGTDAAETHTRSGRWATAGSGPAGRASHRAHHGDRAAGCVRHCTPETALIGFAGSPWTVICYMIEGHGSREFAEVRGLAYADPALFTALLDPGDEATVTYLAAQIEAGRRRVMLFDSWAGRAASRAVPPLRDRADANDRDGAEAALPPCSNHRVSPPGRNHARRICRDRRAGGGRRHRLPIRSMRRAPCPRTVALQGNLDPLVLVRGALR